MAVKYKSVVTTAGQARIAAAMQGGTQVDIKTMVVGDGNGQPTTPSSSQTTLVHEVYRKAVNSVKVDKTHKNWLVTEVIIPASAGGFWMRELGLLAGDGTLLAVCNMAETYKPALEEGSGRTQTLRMVIAVSGSEAIALTLDDSLVFATEEYVNQQVAARNVVDEIYPVGIVTWFAQNKNPNTLFPNTTWNSIGENKTIRLAKADGSDVMTIGGKDIYQIEKNHLPSLSLGLSGRTSSNGGHTHTRGTMNITGNIEANQLTKVGGGRATGAFSSYRSGLDGVASMSSNSDGFNFDASKSWTGNTSNSGVHDHTFSGNTEIMGSGLEFNVTNSFIKLMGWYRSA
ncbi:hypothetical protein FVB43_02080 [Erwinia rhapontici]|uniref:phage tail protein n=1 Tax=Erwinia rhapontici TaxID=55212 RepID=UPI00143865C6|nr:phage tail protein [Erwinia rhapontici]NKG28835.1 hypothetical protein [Erwinia rhapontici]